jgi:hypothetical protein
MAPAFPSQSAKIRPGSGPFSDRASLHRATSEFAPAALSVHCGTGGLNDELRTAQGIGNREAIDLGLKLT